MRESGCDEYYRIVEAVNRRAGIGTINSLKKNFFVDFERMGLLRRFNRKGEPIGNSKRNPVYSAQLADAAISLIKSTSIVERHKIFTDALDRLFANELTHIAETIYYSNYKNDPIGIWEFMFILSDDRPKYRKEKIKLIDSYRELKLWQQKRVIDLVKKYCTPKNFPGNKTAQRDFGNWKNEIQQIFTLLKNTVYFDITKSSLRLNTGTYGIFNETQVRRRSLGAKQEYFTHHRIKQKIPSFELDHIVPFSSAKNKVEFRLIDNWRNLVYLRSDKHEEKTKGKDRNIVLTATEKYVCLDDFYGKNRITAYNGVSAVYAGRLATKMQKYNRDILKSVFDYTKN